MNFKQVYLVLIILSLKFLSCKEDADLTNVYVGCFYMHDQKIAIPKVFTLNNRTVRLYDASGQEIDRALLNTDVLAVGDSIEFDQGTLGVKYMTPDGKVGLYSKNDTSAAGRLSSLMPSFYRPVLKAKINEIRMKSILKSGVWYYRPTVRVPNSDLEIEHNLIFNDSEMIDVTINRYDGKELYREHKRLDYMLINIDEQIFLSINPLNAEENPYPLLHLLEGNENEIRWVRNDDRFPVEESLLKSDNLPTNVSLGKPFDRCFNAAVGEYYYGDFTYQEGNQYLINRANEELPKSNINGYITVHFHINCHGAVGEIGIEQMDFEFKQEHYDSEVVNHLIDMVSNLNSWPAITNESKRLKLKDVHAFLMFKFKDGKIIDLCP